MTLVLSLTLKVRFLTFQIVVHFGHVFGLQTSSGSLSSSASTATSPAPIEMCYSASFLFRLFMYCFHLIFRPKYDFLLVGLQ